MLSVVGAALLGLSIGLTLPVDAFRVQVVVAPAPTRPLSGVAGIASQREAPLAAPTLQVAPDEDVEPTATTEDNPVVAASPSAAPSSGDAVIATRTIQAPSGFSGGTLRAGPSTSSQSLVVLSNGTEVEQLVGSATGEDYEWIRVRTADGRVGWIVTVVAR
jgi:hypothetical protein